MAKVIFGFVLIMAISSLAFSYQYAGAGNFIKGKEATSALKCFADQLVPANAQDHTVLGDDFISEIVTFIQRSHPSIYNTNSAFKKCLDLISMTEIMNKCKTLNTGFECEIVDKITAARVCPKGFSRLQGDNSIDASNCYSNCPENYKGEGRLCIKPNSYVLNSFRNEMDCMKANNGKPCEIYHVKYFVPDCAENFYRLGSTVCIPNCPKNFEDHETFCVRPEFKMSGKTAVTWTVTATSV